MRPKPRKKKPNDERARRSGRNNTRPRSEEDAEGTRDGTLDKMETKTRSRLEARK